MDDSRIIELLFDRREHALNELSQKYSPMYKGILRKFVDNQGDIDECANDVLIGIWNSIPPNRPDCLPAYICKIARYVGIDRLRHNKSAKRSCGYTVLLSELQDCLPDDEPIDDGEQNSELIRSILSDFLRELDPETQILFVRRYMYLESVAELAARFKLRENRVSVRLYRARKKLRIMLEKEGIYV